MYTGKFMGHISPSISSLKTSWLKNNNVLRADYIYAHQSLVNTLFVFCGFILRKQFLSIKYIKYTEKLGFKLFLELHT